MAHLPITDLFMKKKTIISAASMYLFPLFLVFQVFQNIRTEPELQGRIISGAKLDLEL